MKIYERRVASLAEDNTGATNPTLKNSAAKRSSQSFCAHASSILARI
jgi:hypothetical protein